MLIFALFFMTSCAKENIIGLNETQNDPFRVKKDELLDLAIANFELTRFQQSLPENRADQQNARTTEFSLFGEENELKEMKTVTDEDGTDLLHILNFRSKDRSIDKKGFVIMSSDRRAIPILAWSDTNDFSLEGDRSPAVEMWLGFAKEVVKKAKHEKEASEEAVIYRGKLDNYLSRKNAKTTDDWCWHPNPLICDPCPNDYHYLVGPLTQNVSLWGQGWCNSMMNY